MAKHTERYDPATVGPLVERAKLGDTAARDRLILQYQQLIVSLVDLCTTAKFNPNPRGKHFQFLRLFGSKTKPLADIAHTIKNQLTPYTWEELHHVGNIAAAEAIVKTNKNYTSTLVICFSELIKDMIKDGKMVNLDETYLADVTTMLNEDAILFNVFMASLDEEEWLWARKALDEVPQDLPPPKSLIQKLAAYMSYPL